MKNTSFNPSMNPNLNNITSDHTKQIADFTLKNGLKLKLVTHNMLNKCTEKNNAWAITETDSQYRARLSALAADYRQDIQNGAAVIGLQEAPKDPADRDQFIKDLNLGPNWRVVEGENSKGQKMLTLYDTNVVGEQIPPTKYSLGQRAITTQFNVGGEILELTNVHASIDTKDDEIKNLMRPETGKTKIRFGDHNANQDSFEDLMSYPTTSATSISHDAKRGLNDKRGNTKAIKRYDGFACSDSNVTVALHPPKTFSINNTPNGQTAVLNDFKGNIITQPVKTLPSYSTTSSFTPDIITAPSPQQLTMTTVAPQPTQKITTPPTPPTPPTPTQVKPKADNAVLANGAPEKSATISAVESKDKVIIPLSPSGSVLPNSSSPKVSSGGGVDPITQAIRDEVLTKQQLYLQQEIAKIIPVEERTTFLNQDLSSFRAFLQTEDGKEKLASAMQKPETENQLKNIESNGYKEVHSQFQDSFKNVSWVPLPNSKTRLSDIKGPDGQHITYLRETTVQAATQVALADGTMRTINSYRQIEFPKEIEGGKGPVHFSMALKDENGRNVPEKGAVYFTAHYDDKGKLTEVSSPVPVKFMGKGDDAIGYIERGGKVFTLPVTQGKYKEMMLEVAANKGIGANVSQSVETVAQDKVTAVKDSPKVVSQAKDLGNTYKQKMSYHQPKPPITKPKSNVGMSM